MNAQAEAFIDACKRREENEYYEACFEGEIELRIRDRIEDAVTLADVEEWTVMHEMPAADQAALLHAFHMSDYREIGSILWHRFDARLNERVNAELAKEAS